MLLWIATPITAQIQEHSLTSNPLLPHVDRIPGSIRSDEPLKLPFADDFSGTVGYPDPALWADDQAFVNQSLGLNAPSIGVATLDGLNAKGLPYGGGYGSSDTLTSRPIDLSTESMAFLSFYIQPKGIGYLPRVMDSLVVEGKNRDGQWSKLEVFEGLDNSYVNKDAPEFRRVSIPLGSEFRHEAFQFRFRNYSPNRGLESLWHLDYVLVTRQSPDLYINDMAFTAPPAYLLQRYSAYPLSQIQRDPERLSNQLPISLQNNSRDRLTIDTSRVEIYNTEDNRTIFADESLLEIPPIVPVNQRNINPGPAHFTNTYNLRNLTDYLTGLETDRAILATEYEYVMRSEDNLPTFRQNNRVVTRTHFDNFIAYDDYTVEGSISTYNGNGIKTRIAVEYDLLEADSLQSIRILFPYLVENYEHKEFNLLIYVGELGENADYTLYNLTPKRGNHFQPFTEYVVKDYLPEGIFLPAGKFYIGWEHPRGTNTDYIPVGFDKNTPEANAHIYYHVGSGWLNVGTDSPDLRGAVMIRPVVGQLDLLSAINGSVKDLSHEVFPNPATSTLYFRSNLLQPGTQYKIFGMSGQLASTGTIGPGQTSLDISGLLPGSYYINLNHSDQTILGKIRFIKM